MPIYRSMNRTFKNTFKTLTCVGPSLIPIQRAPTTRINSKATVLVSVPEDLYIVTLEVLKKDINMSINAYRTKVLGEGTPKKDYKIQGTCNMLLGQLFD